MAEKGTESGQDQHVTAPEPPKLLPEVLHGGSSPAQLVLSSSKEAKRVAWRCLQNFLYPPSGTSVNMFTSNY